jgi:hypothetical protein
VICTCGKIVQVAAVRQQPAVAWACGNTSKRRCGHIDAHEQAARCGSRRRTVERGQARRVKITQQARQVGQLEHMKLGRLPRGERKPPGRVSGGQSARLAPARWSSDHPE